MPESFRPGFRISRTDAGVLVTSTLAVAAVARHHVELAVLAATVVLHFFLFCNVFRVARAPELLWAAVFVGSVVARHALALPWLLPASVVLLTTLAIIGRELRKPSYHGIGWQRWNPGLPEWYGKQRL